MIKEEGNKRSDLVYYYFFLSALMMTFSYGLVLYFLNSNALLCAISFIAFLLSMLFLVLTLWGEKTLNLSFITKEKLIVFLLVPCAYITLKSIILKNHEPLLFYDSISYLGESTWRSFTIPFIYSILNKDPDRIVLFQTLLATFSSLAMSIVFYYSIREKFLRLIIPVIFLLFTLSYSIIEWEVVLISESICFSLLLVLSSATIIGFRQHQRFKDNKLIKYAFFIVWAMLVFLYSNTRDTNLYLLIVCLPIMLYMLLRFEYKKKIIAIILVLFVTIGYQYWDSTKYEIRWLPNLMNAIYTHALVENNDINYFIKENMPIKEDVLSNNLTLQEFYGAYFDNNEELRSWLAEKGKITYMKYLISQPLKVNMDLVANLDEIFLNTVLRSYVTTEISDLSKTLDYIFFFPIEHINELLVVLLLSFPIVLFLIFKKHRQLNVINLLFVLFFYTQTFLGYYGDGQESQRHAFLGNILFRVSLVLLCCSLYLAIKAIIENTVQNRVSGK
ncbi:hypothetical protein ABEX25_08300 [Paenibacillus thiaminolyticus]|uniref:hypothetical protein n=1 Tax=Paenibacillus thiaminolyticus TaxID=49283 RepID=UPI003D2E8AF0